MAKPVRYIEQNIIDVYFRPINVQYILETDLTDEILDSFLGVEKKASPRSIGIAPAYTPKARLAVLAIALEAKVILLQFRSASARDKASIARQLLEDRVLCSDQNIIYAFDLAKVALALFADHNVCLANAVDFQSICGVNSSRRDPVFAIKSIISGTTTTFHHANAQTIFDDSLWNPEDRDRKCNTFLSLRAWAASYFPTFDGAAEDRFREVARVNMRLIRNDILHVLAEQLRGDQYLETQRDMVIQHDFVQQRVMDENGLKVKVTLGRFQTRMRRPQPGSRGQWANVTLRDDRGNVYVVHGRITDVRGYKAVIELRHPHNFIDKTILSISSEGQNGPTAADLAKAAHVLQTLQCQSSFDSHPFLQLIWPTANQGIEWPATFLSIPAPPIILASNNHINESQKEAILHMLEQSNDKCITIVQGPPGTGKTTVIATYVLSAITAGQTGIWLVAQSNVAVKNIAEKLLKVGFENWKLLVSQDFHMDWHEHYYYRINPHVIVSDKFADASEELQDCQVILCTLSMLSNPRITLFTSKIPISSLVVDEASQINVSHYIDPLLSFPTIRKLCFIGDDKQLPPYGQGEMEEIQSIFEISHLRSTALFLDMQYRMPAQIGNFISDNVYDGQLRSYPGHFHANDMCAFFVQVQDTAELPHGTSYKNSAEMATIIKMAQKLQAENENFKIITPYLAQRTLLEDGLKTAALNWQNKCFAVDSFQGNEEDVIILSLVRTSELGFLEDLRRTNVMLTRCKQFLFIVSSWNFLVNGPGANSLVGRMAACLGDDAWIWPDDIDTGNW